METLPARSDDMEVARMLVHMLCNGHTSQDLVDPNKNSGNFYFRKTFPLALREMFKVAKENANKNHHNVVMVWNLETILV